MMDGAGETALTTDLARSFFESNVQALGLDGRTLDLVRGAEPRGEFVTLPDGNLALRVDGEILGASAEAHTRDQTIADVRGNNGGVVVIFGIGTGQTARQIREWTPDPVVIFEPDPGILRKYLEWGPTDLGNMTVFCELSDLREQWDRLGARHWSTVMVRSPGYSGLFSAQEADLSAALSTLVANTSIRENTLNVKLRQWVRHLIRNTGSMPGSVPFMALAGAFPNVPAFVVGAGPSLDRNGPLLREAAKRGIVFSVDMAGKAFVKHGAEPHVIVTVEAFDHRYQLESLPFIDKVVRAFSLQANPNTWATGRGPLMPFYELTRAYRVLESLMKVPGVAVGGNVSTAAFSMALALGCSPIVLLGQDLAYTGGRQYAGGTPLETMVADTTQKPGLIVLNDGLPPQELHVVEAWGGQGLVNTGPTWSFSRVWLETSAETIQRNSKTRLVNATEGGSRIRGFEEKTLEAILAEFPETSISPQMLFERGSQVVSPLTPHAIVEWVKTQRKIAQSIRDEAEKLMQTARTALRAMDSRKPAKVSATFQRLEHAESSLRRAMGTQSLLEGWLCEPFQAAARMDGAAKDVTDARTQAEQGLRAEMELATGIVQGATEMDSELQELLVRVTQ